MTTEQVVIYSNFSGGEYGLKSGLHAPPNSWTGKNMLLYQNGALGPRAGLIDLAPTGVPSGILRGMGWASYSGKTMWFIINQTVYGFDQQTIGSAVATYTGAGIPVLPTVPVASALGPQGTYITNYGDATYLLDHSTRVVSELTGSPGGRTICLYNDNMVVAGTSAVSNRLHYSAPADYNDWPAGNYIDIGDSWQIRAIYPQRTHILIAKEDGSWWIIYGTLGENDSLRKVYGTGAGSADPNLSVSAPWSERDSIMLESGKVMFIPNAKDYPAYFTGAVAKHERHLQFLGGISTNVSTLPPTMCMKTLNYDDEVAVVSGMEGTGDNRMLLLHEGAWTYHTFDVNIGGWLAMGGGDRAIIASAGSDAPSTAPKFYGLKTYLNRPGVVGGAYESVGDASNTAFAANFTLPEWWSGPNEEVRVRSVTVDFLQFNPNGGQTNHFDIIVTAFRQHEGSSTASATQSFDEASASGSSSGVPCRITKKFGDQGQGAGFQIALSAIRGVAIKSIEVTIEKSPRRS